MMKNNNVVTPWSDHNLHDPGITLLEHLAYAISDLSYRLGFGMADLLAESGASQETKAFFSATDILPRAPLSLLDYRKLLLDKEGVKNAWVSVLKTGKPGMRFDNGIIHLKALGSRRPKYLHGFYKVEIEPEDPDNPPQEQTLRSLLAGNRSLCEDVQFIHIFGEQDIEPVTLRLDLEVVDNQVDLARLFDRIAADLSQWIAPGIRFYSLPEMLQRGKSIDEIFAGPLLEHGFLDDAEIKQYDKKTALRASDVLHRVMDVPGVKLVRQILMSTPNQADQKQYLSLNDQLIPRLKRLEVNVFSGGQRLFHKEATLSDNRKNTYAEKYDVPVPEGRYRDPGRYFSIANELPANYGIGPAGLPANASPRRQAQARQLKAYLAIFEQLLANHFGQLAQLRNLFSPTYDEPATYILNPLDTADGIPGITSLLKPGFPDTNLRGKLESETQALERHNRRLDHLLARFGEQFPYPPASDVVDPAVMQLRKQQLLKDYAHLSTNRNIAVDYYNPPLQGASPLPSGLESRLRRLLGIGDFDETEFPLLDIDFYQEADEDGISEYRFRVWDRAENKIVLSSSKHYHDLAEARLELRWALQRAAQQSGYDLEETKEETPREYFNIVDPSDEVIARRIEYFPKSGRNKSRSEAINRLKTLCAPIGKQEYLYIIEHSLIAPRQSDNDAMFEPRWKVIDPPDKKEYYDPWSMQLSAVLPDFAGRFAGGKNSEFGLFVRDLVESETPAHLTPKCCWLGLAELRLFETHYYQLLRKLRLGCDTTAETKVLNRILGLSERSRGDFQAISLHIGYNAWERRSQYFSLPAAAIPAQNGNSAFTFTISFWIRFNSEVQRTGDLFEIRPDPLSAPLIKIQVNFRSKQLCFICGVSMICIPLSSWATDHLGSYAGKWMHLAFTYDIVGTALRRMSITVNGREEITSNEVGELPTIRPEKAQAKFGNINTKKDIFNMNIADFRIWDIARTERQILTDMDARLAGDEFGLRAYWKFDGTNADSTPNHNDAMIFNCAFEG